MEEATTNAMLGGFKEFLAMIEWPLFFVFIILSWVMNIPRKYRAKDKGTWYRKIPTAIWVTLLGVLLSFIYAMLTEDSTIGDYKAYFNTIIFGLAVWKFGIHRLADKLENKLLPKKD